MTDLTREEVEEWMRIVESADDRGYLHTGVPVDDLRALCAMALRALDAGWQSMETAPRDGTRVLVACVGLYRQGTEAAHWDSEFASWETDDDRTIHPDAWMPLPPPFTGDAKVLAQEPGECARCVDGTIGLYTVCPDCNGTGKRKGGEHG